ncbi:MAG: sugar ABC transporter permease [Anaerolineae bacterium]|nr:sugar ABC transporter permease [Candidatus Roseilinea sp.]MDW8448399.1 sugar ABC transporter permease [Anaerolineae bacterium]
MTANALTQSSTRARRRWRLTLQRREAIACALFIAPAVFGFLAFSALPLLASAYLSMTDYSLAGVPNFVGLANYQSLFSDRFFWQAVRVTLTYAIVIVPAWIVSSLALALIMNQNLRGMAAFRTVYYLPAVLSGVGVVMLWIWIFNYRSGLLNIGLGFLGIQGPNWLRDRNWALFSIMLMSLWSVGWYLPIWLSGLQGIPTELYEAAEVDGAGTWARLWHITLPMLSPIMLYNLVINILFATQLFTEPLMMTGGGPDLATLSYVLYMYNNAFSYLKVGHASAMSWLLFLVSLVVTALIFKLSPLWVHFEAERRGER